MYLPNERLDSTSTAVNLVKSDFANDLGAVLSAGSFGLAESNARGRRKGDDELSQLLDLLDLTGEPFREDFLQCLPVVVVSGATHGSRFNGLPGSWLRNSSGSH